MSNTENSYQETDLGNVSPHPADEYDPEVSYEYLDVVNYKGGSYICRVEDGTVTGVAPAHGKNTDVWQLLTLPGDLTLEYIAMHDDVVNKAKQVEKSRAAAELAQQETEAAQADVQQLHSDTVEAAQKASDSRDSAAGYAQAAETSRQAAAESEQNVNAQVYGFDSHVSESVTQAQEEIAATRQQAIRAVASQQVTSTQAVKDQTASYIAEKETSAKTEIGNYTSEKVAEINNKASEANITLANTIAAGTSLKTQLETTISTADTSKKNLDASDTAAGKTKTALDVSNTTATKTKADLDASNTTASEAKTELDTTNKTAADLVASLGDKITEGTRVKTDIQTTGETAMSNLQAEATKQQEYIKTSIDDTLSISGKAADAAVTGKKMDSLKEDISNKITKFYTSNQGETHITDSDNGKIQDMMLYGKSEQNQYKGINLLPTSISYGEIIEVSIPKGTRIFWATDGTPAIGGNFKFYNEDKTQEMWFGIDAGKITMTETMDIDAKYMEFLIEESELVKICLGIGDDPVYEPYTGGQPSPSPDYPQEIKSVVNPTVKIVGANIMQLNSIGEITVGGSGITVSCKDGVIKAKGTALKDYTIPLGGSAEFIVMKNMTLQNNKTYIFNPNPIKQTESSECYLDFTNSDNLGISLSNNNINNPFKPTDSQTQYPFNLNIIIKQGTVVDVEWKPQLLLNESLLPYKPYTEQSVTLPITLNAIPVSSGGNVTIGGQQYIADYVDVERGKLVRMVGVTDQDTFEISKWSNGSIVIYSQLSNVGTDSAIVTISSKFTANWSAGDEIHHFTQPTGQTLVMVLPKTITTIEQGEEIRAKGFKFYYILVTPIEIDLTTEEITAFKALVTYYPTTNISISSEQLDGYAVFNYPISMENGWNYVKKQLNDNRDYIYDMDIQSAEAYVNSEYAVALTELEV